MKEGDGGNGGNGSKTDFEKVVIGIIANDNAPKTHEAKEKIAGDVNDIIEKMQYEALILDKIVYIERTSDILEKYYMKQNEISLSNTLWMNNREKYGDKNIIDLLGELERVIRLLEERGRDNWEKGIQDNRHESEYFLGNHKKNFNDVFSLFLEVKFRLKFMNV